MKRKVAGRRGRLPESFMELNALHMLRPINDAVAFENAQEIADALAVLERRTADQDDYLESLSLLMERYENGHSPINGRTVSPKDVLKYLMEGRGMSESDLGRVLGERSLGHAILSGKRKLSQSHIRKLCTHFSVGPQLFLRV
jgi:antitoxin component HigA of HigAB toxin-antitoxin module